MAYTYDPALLDDVSLVRFHIGDNADEGHYLDDREIQYFVNNGSVGEAVVKCIKFIIAKLSAPNFRLDWLSVSNDQARAGYEALLKLKGKEFGINVSSVSFGGGVVALPIYADDSGSEYG